MILDYYDAVEAAIEKHARNRTEEEKKDIRQQIYLDLLVEGKRVSTKNVKKLISESVLKHLRGSRKEDRLESLDEPSVFRIADANNAQEFEVFSGVDLSLIEDAVNKLPAVDRLILTHVFGLGTQITSITDLSKWMKKPRIWVKRKKIKALEKVRMILKTNGEKNGYRANNNN